MAEALTLPTLPLILRIPALSLLRKLSPLLFGLPLTLLRVFDPLPDFIVPGVLGLGAALMFSMSLLLSLSMEVYTVVVVLMERFSMRPGDRDSLRFVLIRICHSSSPPGSSLDDRWMEIISVSR